MTADTLAVRTSPLARLDCRVRVAATLLAAAPRAEQGLVAAMAGAAALAAWPLGDDVYAFVAVPAALLLATLIRFHTDRLGARREALAAAGAAPGDLAVIQAAGPLGGTGAGALAGGVAALAAGSPQSAWRLLLPLGIALIATLALRPAWVGAPALGAGAAAAAVASTAVVLSAPARSGTALVAATHARSTAASLPGTMHAAWDHGWLPAVAGLAVLGAAQAAVRRIHGRNQG